MTTTVEKIALKTELTLLPACHTNTSARSLRLFCACMCPEFCVQEKTNTTLKYITLATVREAGFNSYLLKIIFIISECVKEDR